MSPATELNDELSNMISYSSVLLSRGQEDENISKIENCLETSLVTTRQQGGGQHSSLPSWQNYAMISFENNKHQNILTSSALLSVLGQVRVFSGLVQHVQSQVKTYLNEPEHVWTCLNVLERVWSVDWHNPVWCNVWEAKRIWRTEHSITSLSRQILF